MVSPGGLVKAVAAALGVPEATIIVHDRNLAAAGLRRKGGRGRSAAVMTPHDAAALLISVMASPDAVSSAPVTKWYSELVATPVASATRLSDLPSVEEAETQLCDSDSWPDVPGATMRGLGPGHSFLDAIAALIVDSPVFETAAWGDVRVSVYDPIPKGMIEMAWQYSPSELVAMSKAWVAAPEEHRGAPPQGRMKRSVFYQDKELHVLANADLLRQDADYLKEKYGDRNGRILNRRSSVKLSALVDLKKALNT